MINILRIPTINCDVSMQLLQLWNFILRISNTNYTKYIRPVIFLLGIMTVFFSLGILNVTLWVICSQHNHIFLLKLLNFV